MGPRWVLQLLQVRIDKKARLAYKTALAVLGEEGLAWERNRARTSIEEKAQRAPAKPLNP